MAIGSIFQENHNHKFHNPGWRSSLTLIEYIPRIMHMVHVWLDFVVLRYQWILPICFRVASPALGKSYNEAALKNMGKYCTRTTGSSWYNHNYYLPKFTFWQVCSFVGLLLAKIYILASMFVCRFVTCQNLQFLASMFVCRFVCLSVCLSVCLLVCQFCQA